MLKFGGFAYYCKLRPVFLRVILGECLIGGIWIVVGLSQGLGIDCSQDSDTDR